MTSFPKSIYNSVEDLEGFIEKGINYFQFQFRRFWTFGEFAKI
jgi:hypothetical protein